MSRVDQCCAKAETPPITDIAAAQSNPPYLRPLLFGGCEVIVAGVRVSVAAGVVVEVQIIMYQSSSSNYWIYL